jgi:hypothetical protein
LSTGYVENPLQKTITTGWSPKTGETSSNILALWGMSDNLSLWDDPDRDLDIVGLIPDQNASRKTSEYTLLMTYGNGRTIAGQPENAGFRLATRDSSGRWINAVESNFGGRKKFVEGAWAPGRYSLGTCGIDTNNGSVWAVINHSNKEFAVVRGV